MGCELLEHVIIILYNDDRIQLTFGLNIATIKNDKIFECIKAISKFIY